jgi:hypothetical protein
LRTLYQSERDDRARTDGNGWRQPVRLDRGGVYQLRAPIHRGGQSWGAQATNGSGRKSTAGQVTFPTVGATGSLVNGFFIATTSASGASDKVLYFANFDDGAAVDLHTNDVLKCTPSWQNDG